VEYFVYGRDRAGTYGLKESLSEEHWSFMDGYGELLIARGPTLTGRDDEDESTGSLHIVDLPDAETARRFAYDEPYYRAGVFESVLICRFHNILGRTMWDFTEVVDGYSRFLLIAMDASAPARAMSKHLIVYGDLLSLDGDTRLGWAAAVEAPNREAAATMSPAGTDAEVHHWTFGGRPGQRD
jgi:uncharacterized protein YciI